MDDDIYDSYFQYKKDNTCRILHIVIICNIKAVYKIENISGNEYVIKI